MSSLSPRGGRLSPNTEVLQLIQVGDAQQHHLGRLFLLLFMYLFIFGCAGSLLLHMGFL